MNADKNYALFISVYPRSSAAQDTFCVGWQPTSDASSRLADKKAVLNFGVQFNWICFNETQY
jgi:hypothetical protein